jgi:hypothetical protein
MHAGGPNQAYRCLARSRQGPTACANATGARQDEVEAQVLAALQRDLLHPAAIEAFVAEYRAARQAAGAHVRARRAGLERASPRPTPAPAAWSTSWPRAWSTGPTVSAKLAELEARAAAIAAELASADTAADVVTLHPHAAQRYRDLVEDLQAALAGAAPGSAAPPASAELTTARAALRQVITAVVIHPADLSPGVRASTHKPRAWTLELKGDLSALLADAGAPAEGFTAARR